MYLSIYCIYGQLAGLFTYPSAAGNKEPEKYKIFVHIKIGEQ
jgi:hypothetical protein